MDQQPFFKDNYFTLTREMFITRNVRYAICFLNSIRLVKSRREIPYGWLVLEVLLIVGGFGWKYPYHEAVGYLGIAGLIVSGLLFAFVKPVHKLYVTFASGEREMIESADYVYLETLANAFSKSITEARQPEKG